MTDDLVTFIEISQRARDTSAEGAIELESAVRLDPNNLRLRCRLFCYYKLNNSAQKLVDELLWCIRNAPYSEYAWFVATRALGANLRTARSKDYAVIKNAWWSKLENESDAKSFVTAADFFF